MDALQIANSFPMWIACGVAVVLVIVQALIFIKKAIDAAPEVGVTKEQVNKAIKSSALTWRSRGSLSQLRADCRRDKASLRGLL